MSGTEIAWLVEIIIVAAVLAWIAWDRAKTKRALAIPEDELKEHIAEFARACGKAFAEMFSPDEDELFADMMEKQEEELAAETLNQEAAELAAWENHPNTARLNKEIEQLKNHVRQLKDINTKLQKLNEVKPTDYYDVVSKLKFRTDEIAEQREALKRILKLIDQDFHDLIDDVIDDRNENLDEDESDDF